MAAIDFVTKPWVVDPDQYLADNSNKDLNVGFSQRLARSPSEATTLALENTNRRGSNTVRATPNQIVDRFTQKLKLSYGELWQESVLVDHSIRPSKTIPMAGEFQDHTHLVQNPDGPQPAVITSHGDHAAQPFHQQEGGGVWAGSNVARGGGVTPGLILTAIGLIAIGLLSNLLTQGYYRQNIRHTVITGVAVVFGFLVLVLFVA